MQAAAPVAPGFAVVPAPTGPEPAPEALAPEAAPEPEPAPTPEPTPLPEPEAPAAPVGADPAPDPNAELLGGAEIVLPEPVAPLDVVPADDEPAPHPGADATALLPALPAPRRRLMRPRLPHGGGLPLPRPDRGSDTGTVTTGDPGPVFRLVLPAAAIVIAVLVMLAIAGVFGGADPAPAGLLLPAG